MMKLLLLADGRSAHTMRYQKELKNQGIDVVLASLEKGETVDILMQKSSVSKSLNYFFANREIKELARKFNPDIINPHFASGYGFTTAVSRVWKKIPVALHCLGSDILISPEKSIVHKRRVIYALEKADMIFADSNFLAEQIRKLHDTDQISVIPWGVENEILDMFEKRDLNRLKNKEMPRVLVPRPHQKVYNNIFIIESLRELLDNRKISMTFPEWGDDLEGFRQFVKNHCPNAIIEYYAFMPRHEFVEFLSGFDIYLSAALSDSSPASLIEAMGAGMFPVVGHIPGVREWMDENGGLLFNLEKRESLKQVFAKLLDFDLDFPNILSLNHNRVKENGRFSENIKNTIRQMEEVRRRERK